MSWEKRVSVFVRSLPSHAVRSAAGSPRAQRLSKKSRSPTRGSTPLQEFFENFLGTHRKSHMIVDEERCAEESASSRMQGPGRWCGGWSTWGGGSDVQSNRGVWTGKEIHRVRRVMSLTEAAITEKDINDVYHKQSARHANWKKRPRFQPEGLSEDITREVSFFWTFYRIRESGHRRGAICSEYISSSIG
jgi:hypothetical protein